MNTNVIPSVSITLSYKAPPEGWPTLNHHDVSLQVEAVFVTVTAQNNGTTVDAVTFKGHAPKAHEFTIPGEHRLPEFATKLIAQARAAAVEALGGVQ